MLYFYHQSCTSQSIKEHQWDAMFYHQCGVLRTLHRVSRNISEMPCSIISVVCYVHFTEYHWTSVRCHVLSSVWCATYTSQSITEHQWDAMFYHQCGVLHALHRASRNICEMPCSIISMHVLSSVWCVTCTSQSIKEHQWDAMFYHQCGVLHTLHRVSLNISEMPCSIISVVCFMHFTEHQGTPVRWCHVLSSVWCVTCTSQSITEHQWDAMFYHQCGVLHALHGASRNISEMPCSIISVVCYVHFTEYQRTSVRCHVLSSVWCATCTSQSIKEHQWDAMFYRQCGVLRALHRASRNISETPCSISVVCYVHFTEHQGTSVRCHVLMHVDITEPLTPMSDEIQSHFILLKYDIALIKKFSNYQEWEASVWSIWWSWMQNANSITCNYSGQLCSFMCC